MNFNFFMNYHLVKKGYTNIEEIPVEEIIDTIKEYLRVSLKKKQPHDIEALFQEFSGKVDDKEKDLGIIIHYLLGYLSMLQHFEIVWYINDALNPTFTYNKYEPNKIDGLNTSRNIDYVKVFQVVLDKVYEMTAEREEGLIR